MATYVNNEQPTCHNCETSTTPLWRRDEHGAILCNACGLFLKLHGRPRPISLKTDVIKSRNRVKTVRPDLAKQKKAQQHPGMPTSVDANGTDPNGARRGSQKLVNGHVDDTNSPISRTGTPNMYNHGIGMYPSMDDPQFQGQSLPGFSVTGASPGRAASPMNGDNVPQTHEQLIAANASLKTRVNELEVIQELYRGRLQQLETEQQAREIGGIETQLRSELATVSDSEAQLRKELDESHRRENMLKRRLDELELELELKNSKESPDAHDNGRAKKPRLDEPVEKAEQPAAPTPQSES
ncbi:hypothetical protein GQ53DRAFT_661060 [Thozetella sp. PMI_491]|nr:hypothetical protein GQ53DRAFT_661060 [Thozetella sp. PMI_491]